MTRNPGGPITQEGRVAVTYHDAQRSLSVHPELVRKAAVADLGICVSFNLASDSDGGTTTATILIPDIVLDPSGASVSMETVMITTHHKCRVDASDESQREHYTVTTLTGTATMAPFRPI